MLRLHWCMFGTFYALTIFSFLRVTILTLICYMAMLTADVIKMWHFTCCKFKKFRLNTDFTKRKFCIRTIFFSHDFIGEFGTTLRELTRGPGSHNQYAVSKLVQYFEFEDLSLLNFIQFTMVTYFPEIYCYKQLNI